MARRSGVFEIRAAAEAAIVGGTRRPGGDLTPGLPLALSRFVAARDFTGFELMYDASYLLAT